MPSWTPEHRPNPSRRHPPRREPSRVDLKGKTNTAFHMKTDETFHPTIQKCLAELQRIFRETEDVVSAYLFGSFAEGVSRRGSDVDVAVRLTPGLSPTEKHRIRMHLIEALDQIVEKEVDILELEDASLKMIHQVFRHGKAIYVKNDIKEEDFRLQKRKEYFDFQYYIEKEQRDLRAFYDC